MEWPSHDTNLAEHGDDSADFYSTARERGIKTYLNLPVIFALAIAVFVLILLMVV